MIKNPFPLRAWLLGALARVSLFSSFLGLILFALLLTSCPSNIDTEQKHKPAPGMGSVTISFANNTLRTIMPTSVPDIDVFNFFRIEFTPTAAGAAKPPMNLDEYDLNNDTFDPIDLVPGTYTIKVTAFIGGVGDNNIAAEGTAYNVGIVDENDTPVPIPLRMSLQYGTGTFSWQISLDGLSGRSGAIMTLTSLDIPAKIIDNPNLDIHDFNNWTLSRTLPSGLYQLEIHVDYTDNSSIFKSFSWYEILHIYSSLTSHIQFVPTDSYFNDTHVIVTFDYQRPGTTNPGNQSVLHGNFLTTMPNGQETGFTLEGWYRDAACTQLHMMTDNIYEDITLYAKWIDDSTATITLIVDPIVNHTPTFEISLSNTPFAPITVPNPLVLSRTGNPAPNTYYFRISSTGHQENSVSWQIGNNTPVSGDTFTLNVSNAQNFTIGGHTLRLSVTRDGALYMLNIPFTVNAGGPVAMPSYSIGDIGPAGGIIFYVNTDGFTVHGYGVDGDPGYFETYTAHYLEAAPENISGTHTWASIVGLIPELSQDSDDETDWIIGRGRMNTAIIINQTYTTPAVSACVDYRAPMPNETFNDWFLPSRNELNEIWLSRNDSGINIPGSSWSSSQTSNTGAWLHGLVGGGNWNSNMKTDPWNVRAIRAF